MSEALAHHGILGMKWGVRRTPEQLGHITKSTKTVDQKRSEDSKRYDYHNRGTFSDEELRAKIERLRLEKELRDLTMQELSPGKAFANEILKESGKKVLTTMATGAMLYAGSYVVGEKLGKKDLAKSIAQGKAVFEEAMKEVEKKAEKEKKKEEKKEKKEEKKEEQKEKKEKS